MCRSLCPMAAVAFLLCLLPKQSQLHETFLQVREVLPNCLLKAALYDDRVIIQAVSSHFCHTQSVSKPHTHEPQSASQRQSGVATPHADPRVILPQLMEFSISLHFILLQSNLNLVISTSRHHQRPCSFQHTLQWSGQKKQAQKQEVNQRVSLFQCVVTSSCVHRCELVVP